jgi:hypothetical protein
MVQRRCARHSLDCGFRHFDALETLRRRLDTKDLTLGRRTVGYEMQKTDVHRVVSARFTISGASGVAGSLRKLA